MQLRVDAIVGKEKLLNNFEEVEKKVKKYGYVIILNDNNPTYKLSLLDTSEIVRSDKPKRARTTLVEAMIRVLTFAPDKTMHAKDLAEEITDQELYFMKDGSVVSPVQIRTRAGNNLDKFECLPGNFIKLRTIT